jgi:hypothetical protein
MHWLPDKHKFAGRKFHQDVMHLQRWIDCNVEWGVV